MFIKNYIESTDVTLAQEVPSHDKEIECERIKSDLKLVKKELHDARSKLEGYEKENISLNQKVFILKGELATQTDFIEKNQEDRISIDRDSQSVKDKLNKALKETNECKKTTIDREDTIEMLNMTILNKNLEIASLKKEIIESQENTQLVNLLKQIFLVNNVVSNLKV